MHNRACVSFSSSRHMITLESLSGISSIPFDCIIFSPFTSWSIMNPTSRQSKSSKSPFLFGLSVDDSSSFNAIMEPPKRLWFCAFVFIIVPIASRVSTWSFGSTVMVAVKRKFVKINGTSFLLVFHTLHHLDLSRWHRWQVIVGHEIAKFCDKFKCTRNTATHLIKFTTYARHHLIGVGCQNECDINGILINRLMENTFADHKPNRINYNKIVKAKI